MVCKGRFLNRLLVDEGTDVGLGCVGMCCGGGNRKIRRRHVWLQAIREGGSGTMRKDGRAGDFQGRQVAGLQAVLAD